MIMIMTMSSMMFMVLMITTTLHSDQQVHCLTSQRDKGYSRSAAQWSRSPECRRSWCHCRSEGKHSQRGSPCSLLSQPESMYPTRSLRFQYHPCWGISGQRGTQCRRLHQHWSRFLMCSHTLVPPYPQKFIVCVSFSIFFLFFFKFLSGEQGWMDGGGWG